MTGDHGELAGTTSMSDASTVLALLPGGRLLSTSRGAPLPRRETGESSPEEVDGDAVPGREARRENAAPVELRERCGRLALNRALRAGVKRHRHGGQQQEPLGG
jgi:hypothetical protein